MKVLFVRHGQSVYDIEKRYGGWTDYPLTPKGKAQIRKKITAIKSINGQFEAIYSSPLKRAQMSAKILSNNLKIPFQTLEYIKERNTYGLLSGMKKIDAVKKYPIQVKRLEKGKYVDGSERQEDLLIRIKKSLRMIEKSGYKSVVVVTHGNYLKCVFEDIMKRKLTKKEDGGFILVTLNRGRLKPILTNGIEYEIK